MNLSRTFDSWVCETYQGNLSFCPITFEDKIIFQSSDHVVTDKPYLEFLAKIYVILSDYSSCYTSCCVLTKIKRRRLSNSLPDVKAKTFLFSVGDALKIF